MVLKALKKGESDVIQFEHRIEPGEFTWERAGGKAQAAFMHLPILFLFCFL